jgi:hypothetical protein
MTRIANVKRRRVIKLCMESSIIHYTGYYADQYQIDEYSGRWPSDVKESRSCKRKIQAQFTATQD